MTKAIKWFAVVSMAMTMTACGSTASKELKNNQRSAVQSGVAPKAVSVVEEEKTHVVTPFMREAAQQYVWAIKHHLDTELLFDQIMNHLSHDPSGAKHPTDERVLGMLQSWEVLNDLANSQDRLVRDPRFSATPRDRQLTSQLAYRSGECRAAVGIIINSDWVSHQMEQDVEAHCHFDTDPYMVLTPDTTRRRQ